MRRILKDSSGFTLVELMVVVAIIGILSAIAVPNFKKYQAKAKQSEAKIQLAAVYTTEVAAQADYDTFASCLIFLGYEKPPKGYYIVGFSSLLKATEVDTRAGGSGCASDTSGFAIAPQDPLRANTTLALPSVSQLSTYTAALDTTTFKAVAAGVISSSGTSTYDAWSINESKTVKMENSGL